MEFGNEFIRIQIYCEDPETLVWLAEFLGPSLCVPGDAPRIRIRYVDNAPPSEFVSGDKIQAFTLHGRFTEHSLKVVDGEHRFRDDVWDVAYRVGTEIEVVVSEGERNGRLALMRVVRELARSARLAYRHLPLHASAFCHRGEAIVVCGARHSGKSTTLVQALAEGALYLSNDRIFVTETLEAGGEPNIIGLRQGTLELFPDLKSRFALARYDRALTIAECHDMDRVDPVAFPGTDLPSLSPAQLCALLGSEMGSIARVGLILFPQVDSQISGIQTHRLEPSRVATLLESNLMAGSSPIQGSEVFKLGVERSSLDDATVSARCRQLAVQVPAFALTLGQGSHRLSLLQHLEEL